MKKSIPAIVLILLFFVSNAQDQETFSGLVKYNIVTKVDIKIEGDASQFADMLPKEMKSSKELLFNSKASLYRKSETSSEMNSMMHSSDAHNIQIHMEEPENIVFTDLEKKTTIEQKEFMTRIFLIDGTLPDQSWKLTGNQKMILDYPCQEAILEGEDGVVRAWFTPVIPVSAGPSVYSGLPGLILEINLKNGDQVILAESVELKPIEDNELKKPVKGKKVTKEEFDKIVAEKVEEMGGEAGEGKVMMIKIER